MNAVKRLNFKKHDTSAVQENSYVVLRRPTMGQMQALMRRNKAINGASEEERNEANLQASMDLLTDLIIEWNWVDDEGNSLALPRSDRSVFDQLTDEEIQMLSGLINPNRNEADAKNG